MPAAIPILVSYAASYVAEALILPLLLTQLVGAFVSVAASNALPSKP